MDPSRTKRIELPAALATLADLASFTPSQAVERLAAIKDALPTCDDPNVLHGIAQALPARVAPLAPEVCLAAAQLAMALAPCAPRVPTDVLELEPRLCTSWLRVQLASGDSSRLEHLDETLLLHVVTGWSLEAVLAPLPLLAHLSRASDPRLRSCVIQWLRPAVQHLALTPQEAFTCLEPLVEDAEVTIRCDALRLLSKCWLLGLLPPAKLRRERLIEAALADDRATVTQAAVEATAELGIRQWLVNVLENEATSAHARADVTTALGPLAQPDDLDLVLVLAAEDPLRFGPQVRLFLLEAHRHGVFLRDHHLAAVLAFFDDHHGWTGEELVRVTHIVRAGLIQHLAELPAHDPRWIRRAAILAASIESGAPSLLRVLLVSTKDARIATALIEAAGKSPDYTGEDLLLSWLDALPEAVIPVLRVKGGTRAVARLRALVEDPFSSRSLRALAMDVLWAHSADRPALMRDLSRQLGPHESGLLDGRHITHRDGSVAQLLIASEWETSRHHVVAPIAQLKTLCESGEIRFLPEVSRLFREVFRGYVRLALAGNFSIKRLQMPELEQMLFRYGRHLVNDGRSVRRWIGEGPETGRDLVLLMVCDWLKESPSSPVCVALLETVGRHSPDAAVLRFIEPFWRRGDENVKRVAIEAILEAGAGARGLELSICKLADAANPRIVCQALAAVRTLRASWAEPIVRAALSRPEMAVKKEAADALAEVGSGNSVPALVKWLSQHDNDSLRTGLHKALQYAAGPSLVSVLVDALEYEAETRSKELLWQALSGHITLEATLRLARSSRPAHRELVDACLDQRVRLADASGDQLAAQLHRARLRPIPPRVDPARRLRLEGFSPEAAQLLVAARDPKLDNQILPVVRHGLADWITWLASSEGAGHEAVTLVLDAADKTHVEHLEALLDCAERTRTRTELEPETVASFIERCVVIGNVGPPQKVRAIGILRSLAPSARLGGLRRYRLLGRLGAVRTATDLEMCLDECRHRPDLAGESAALLFEALSIPAAVHGDPPELVALREEAQALYRADAWQRKKWLTAMTKARPLDLPLVPLPPAPLAKPPFTASSRADLDALLETLREGDDQARNLAARRILAWSDAQPAWDRVLEAFLTGRVELDPECMRRVAGTMTSWPSASQLHPVGHHEARRLRAAVLVPSLSGPQVRAFVPGWLEDWEKGDPHVADLLRAVGQDRLIPFVRARATSGDYRFARLLQPSCALTLRSLIELIGAVAPREVEHLRKPEEETPRDAEGADPVDPIAGKQVDELVALLAEKAVEKGLAVRAVHALATYKERAVQPLERLTVDRRPQVRSAALRALRMVASREQTLEATAQVLKIETRRDVVLQLMASLGHGRHEPSLPGLIERLTDGDLRVRQGAHAALRAWGRDVVPALRHASRRARPDRRPRYAALIAELE